MHDTNAFEAELVIYVTVIIIIGLLIIAACNLLLWVLKLCHVFYERRVSILINLIGSLILIACIVPAVLDICQSSYCTINDVVDIEYDFKTKYSNSYILVTDKSGKVHTCYDYLIDAKDFNTIDYPATVIYATHSRLILHIYTTPAQ